MGMDVFGKAPRSEAGAYFRANVWYWHPLWEYCLDQHTELAERVTYGHSNDGDGLGDAEARALGEALQRDLATGRAVAYLDQREAMLAALPTETCRWCEGTGVRRDDVGVAHGMVERGWCNGCDGTGQTEPRERSYHLDLETLTEFAAFCVDCGGFEIW